MIKHRYVLAHMEFENLPPLLGIFAAHNQIDKIYQQVTAEVTYVVWDSKINKIIDEGIVSHTEFEEFLDKDHQNCGQYKLVHTKLYSAYYYNAMLMSNGKYRPSYDQYLVDQILINAGFMDTKSNFRKELEKFGGPVLDFLKKCAPSFQNGLRDDFGNRPITIDWKKSYKKINAPICQAERLHSKYRHLPDPVQWILTGYQPEEVNEYTEFMNRFNFTIFENHGIMDIYKMLKGLDRTPNGLN